MSFDDNRKKVMEFTVYASFLVASGTYLISNLFPNSKVDPDLVTGKAFVDTTAIMLGVGMVAIVGDAVVRRVRRPKQNNPEP